METQDINVLKTELFLEPIRADSVTFLQTANRILPLAPLTRTDSPTTLLSQVAQTVARIPDIVQQQNITGCLGILAGLRFDNDLIRQFLREEVMQQSVIYQDIVQKEAFRLISRQINRRFRELDLSLITISIQPDDGMFHQDEIGGDFSR